MPKQSNNCWENCTGTKNIWRNFYGIKVRKQILCLQQTIIESRSIKYYSVFLPKKSTNQNDTFMKGSTNQNDTFMKGSTNQNHTFMNGSTNRNHTFMKGSTNQNHTFMKGSTNQNHTFMKA